MSARAPYYPTKTCTQIGNGYWRFDAYGDAIRYTPASPDHPTDSGYDAHIGEDHEKDIVHSHYIRKEYKYGAEVFCIYNGDVLGLTDGAAHSNFQWDAENLEEALRWLHKHTDWAISASTKAHKLDVARANQWHPELG